MAFKSTSARSRWSFPPGCPCDDDPRRSTDERFADKGQRAVSTDAVAQRDEIAVLKCCDPHLSLIQPLRPYADSTRLRYQHEVRAGQGQGAHVVGEMTIVADGHTDPADFSAVDRRPRSKRA